MTHPVFYETSYRMEILSNASDLVSRIRPDSRVFVHGAAATPTRLLDAICERALAEKTFRGIELVGLHTMGEARYASEAFHDQIRVSAFFLGENLRRLYRPGFVDYVPAFLSEIPALFRSGRFPIDVAIVQVSPPDKEGFCTLGTSVDIACAAVEQAGLVLAQINSRMPRVLGDGRIHTRDIDFAILADDPLPVCHLESQSPEVMRLGRKVAEMIEDGSTLQMGIGSVPDAVLAALTSHRNLGIHTEMWSDGALALIRSGVVDNSKKVTHPGKTVSTFFMGSEDLYRFIDGNPSVLALDASIVNSPGEIAKNPKVVAINSAVEIDLTGQVCADSIGSRIISGTGGQMDFVRGASLSKGGKPIIALQSRTRRGESRIVSCLKSGAGVVTTRAHVHFVATEYGVVDLYGKNLDQRAKALIGIAHPGDREGLSRSWRER